MAWPTQPGRHAWARARASHHGPSVGNSTAHGGALVDEVDSGRRHEHGVDRGDRPGNLAGEGAHHRGWVAWKWRCGPVRWQPFEATVLRWPSMASAKPYSLEETGRRLGTAGITRDGNLGTGTRYPPGTWPDSYWYGDDFLPVGDTRTRPESRQVWDGYFFSAVGNLMGFRYFTTAIILRCEQVKMCSFCYINYDLFWLLNFTTRLSQIFIEY
jgi:hypothetical protein